MNIQDSDIELFHYLYHVKIASLKQISRDILPNYTYGGLCNRLAKLEDAGLVIGKRIRVLLKGTKLFSLTKKGFVNFVKKGNEKQIQCSSDSIRHDLKLTDIRCLLIKSSAVEDYYTENQLATWPIFQPDAGNELSFTPNCDALTQIKIEEDTIWAAVEYEMNQKSMPRYADLVTKYYHDESITLVLYISETNRIAEKIIEQEILLFPDKMPKFFFSDTSSILQRGLLTFQNRDNFEISLA